MSPTNGLAYSNVLTIVFGIIAITTSAITLWQNHRSYRQSVANAPQEEHRCGQTKRQSVGAVMSTAGWAERTTPNICTPTPMFMRLVWPKDLD
ncbi:hypothetical protein SBOR_5467 [Sclerotinia borealis F-4128]|uniref:Uncharacterized protein n=1 Tax=Sclerotinia borealis (strain F-4128) TaxID=1432307 RepID=W9CE48_SCLBF|nr:hypothetical protein SBOR_5467 [Sclerotinia borealis F-4128]